MTRRKDTIRVKNQYIKTTYQKINSRLEKKKQEDQLYQEETRQEKQLLLKIQVLPDELIRLIYNYLTGKAKLYFNPKYERLHHEFCSYTFHPDLYQRRFELGRAYTTLRAPDSNLTGNLVEESNGVPFEFFNGINTLLKKMSNAQILDLIYTGTLRKYPEIVEDLSFEYYYSLIDHDFHTVKGYRLLNLWATGRLSYDFIEGEHTANERVNIELDLNIRHKLATAIKDYIWNTLYRFYYHRKDVLNDKKGFEYRNLFLGIEKAYYLYQVVMRFIDNPTIEEVPMNMNTNDPFSNELLIPTPLSITI